jgi:hypothetical protein
MKVASWSIALYVVLILCGMLVEKYREERIPGPLPAPMVMALPDDCRPHHVGEAAAVVIYNNEARCVTVEFKVPQSVWREYLRAKVVAK